MNVEELLLQENQTRQSNWSRNALAISGAKNDPTYTITIQQGTTFKIKEGGIFINSASIDLFTNNITIFSGITGLDIDLADDDLFPIAILQLSHLTELEIASVDNRVIKNIPSLDKLEKLKSLTLQGLLNINELPSIDNLVNLTNLNASFCSIDKLPSLDKLVNLEILAAEGNILTQLPSLDSLVNLESLLVANNEIVQLPSLDSLVNLESLHVANNKIVQLPSLDSLVNLGRLDVANNKMVQLPSLDSLVNLEHLDAANNKIVQLPSLDNLVNLDYLGVENNEIVQLPSLDSLVNLQYLYVANTKIVQLPSLDKLVNLQHLNFANNKIVQLPSLDSLVNIQYLGGNNNNLTQLPPLNKLGNLERLRVGINNLTQLPSLDNLVNLQYLEVANNKIIQLPSLDKLVNLQYLGVANNKILQLPFSDVYNTDLFVLEADNNPFVDYWLQQTNDKLAFIKKYQALMLGKLSIDAYTEQFGHVNYLQYLLFGAQYASDNVVFSIIDYMLDPDVNVVGIGRPEKWQDFLGAVKSAVNRRTQRLYGTHEQRDTVSQLIDLFTALRQNFLGKCNNVIDPITLDSLGDVPTSQIVKIYVNLRGRSVQARPLFTCYIREGLVKWLEARVQDRFTELPDSGILISKNSIQRIKDESELIGTYNGLVSSRDNYVLHPVSSSLANVVGRGIKRVRD